MAKILNLPQPDKQKSLRDFILESVAILEKRGCANVMICAKDENGAVVTGYYNLDLGERQELCAHIQCDIIDKMIMANTARYLGEDI